MTPQDTMLLALEALEYASTGNRRPEIIGPAIEALKAALAQQPDADPNAPWMTEAHHLCSDHGIPHGNLTRRIRALRDKLSQQPELSTASKSEQLLASHDHALRAEFQRMKAALAQQGEQQPVGYQWMGTHHFRVKLPKDAEKYAWRPVYAGAAPAIMETYIKDHKTPLTENAIDDAWYEHVSDVGITSTHTAFQVGVRVAEKHHGIGVPK